MRSRHVLLPCAPLGRGSFWGYAPRVAPWAITVGPVGAIAGGGGLHKYHDGGTWLRQHTVGASFEVAPIVTPGFALDVLVGCETDVDVGHRV